MASGDRWADIAPCDYAVEATDFERLCLWREWHDDARVAWEDEPRGRIVEVGRFARVPVCVCLSWATIAGRRIVFYSATSRVVDHRMVEAWVRAHAMTPDGTHANAMNFHLVVHAIQRASGAVVDLAARRR